MSGVEFKEFPKIARYSRDVIVTEKIDGTNACISIREGDGQSLEFGVDTQVEHDGKSLLIRAGSRSRWISPTDDNFGFAAWVYQNAWKLASLGVGTHFGEWWGSGIQRGYGLQRGEKRFSIFNAIQWCEYDAEPERIATEDPRIVKFQERAPVCVDVVPVLWRGSFDDFDAAAVIRQLEHDGSVASPGFMKPEGIVIYHIAGGIGFKKTITKDEVPKSKHRPAEGMVPA